MLLPVAIVCEKVLARSIMILFWQWFRHSYIAVIDVTASRLHANVLL